MLAERAAQLLEEAPNGKAHRVQPSGTIAIGERESQDQPDDAECAPVWGRLVSARDVPKVVASDAD